MISTTRTRLLASTLLMGAATFASPAFAQTAPADQDESAAEEVVVTGSRIARPNLTANSPIAVVTGEQTTNNADITLDTYLNTLPQVNPAGTSTRSRPGVRGVMRPCSSPKLIMPIVPCPHMGRQPEVSMNRMPQSASSRVGG